jgi:hypothetical protein
MNMPTIAGQRTKSVKKPSYLKRGEPVWELVHLFPRQGEWTEREYLALNSTRLIEFSNGYLEILAMPTLLHQYIVAYLVKTLSTFVEKFMLGDVLFAPLPVHLWRGCE